MLDNNTSEVVSHGKSTVDVFTRFLKPLPGRGETSRPIVTGAGAIKATMLPEQGKRSLAEIQKENIAAQKGRPAEK